ncbi:MAG TPA: hypothetical protein VEZ19_04155 [Rubrobacter sp.]|nr:hypothetical protein [Rubrobacter sp.]
MSTKSAEPVLNTYQVMSAGLAATGAALVTSRFGVAGTLLGAALTAMIITGGSAILRAYIESASSRVREVPTRLRSWGEQRKAGRPDEPETVPGRPDLRANFVGRMRAALDWFSNLPPVQRRSILLKGLVAAVVAFLICMGTVWGVEKVIGNSLSCGFWGTCPVGAAPGIHIAGYDGTGAGSSITGGDVGTGGGAAGGISPSGIFDGGEDNPVFEGNPGGVGQPDNVQSASPEPGASPKPDASPEPDASPAPEEEPDPASASPAAQPEGKNPSSASPAADQ